jgi:autotransporter passenger strand-loop-strand repeat protein
MTISAISSGQTISGQTISSGETIEVLSGGTAVALSVSGGLLEIFAGGFESGSDLTAIGQEYVSSGGTAVATRIGYEGFQDIYAGGTATGAIVSSRGEQFNVSGLVDGAFIGTAGTEYAGGGSTVGVTVGSGGSMSVAATASNTTVSSGGSVTVNPTAIAYDTTVSSGGTQTVHGSASGTVVRAGGTETVNGGGEEFIQPGANGAGIVDGSGGIVFVSSGASLSGATIGSGGLAVVFSGGVATGANVQSGALVASSGVLLFQSGSIEPLGNIVSNLAITSGTGAFILAGGETVSALISSPDGFINPSTNVVFAGGTASASQVQYKGYETVETGGTAISAAVSGGTEIVLSGGLALATEISLGGLAVSGGTASATVQLSYTVSDTVYSGGTAIGTVVNGGDEIVEAGGTALGATVSRGGYEILSGGVASGVTLPAGTELVDAGASAIGTEVSSGGEVIVSSGGTTINTIMTGGGETVSSGGTAIATSAAGGQGGINVYGVASGTVLFSGANEAVEGTATKTIVNSGGSQTIYRGSAISALIEAGAGQDIQLGSAVSTTVGGTEVVGSPEGGYYYGIGVASASTVLSGGVLQVVSGGVAISAIVSAGAVVSVLYGGTEFSGTLGSNVSETISSGGTVIGDTLNGDTNVSVDSGGVASAIVLRSGAAAVISSGGTAIGAIVSSGGVLIVLPGGVDLAPNVAAGGEVVSTGVAVVQPGMAAMAYSAVASNVVVGSGGVEYVLPGGTAVDNTLNAAIGYVANGGTIAGATLGANSTIELAGGGAASDTVLLSGANSLITLNGNAFFGGTTLDLNANAVPAGSAGGAVLLGNNNNVTIGPTATVEIAGDLPFAGITGVGTLVNQGVISFSGTAPPMGNVGAASYAALYSDIASSQFDLFQTKLVNEGTIVLTNSYDFISEIQALAPPAIITGSGAIIMDSNAVLIIGAQTTTDQTIEFAGSGDYLALLDPTLEQAPITGFGFGDAIDLFEDGYTGGQPTYTGGNLVLPTSSGDVTLPLSFAPGVSIADVSLTSDTLGGTIAYVACFASGTRIATGKSCIPVERLRIGDSILTIGGETNPVCWIGRRHVDCHAHPCPSDVYPVRIAAHAFASGSPCYDLYLSPDHAVFIDGVLIPIRYLINDATIVQIKQESVSYWHIELERHEVIFAEGLPCESYLDTGNRGAFANGGAAAHLHPDFALKIWDVKACAPLVLGGAELQAARSHLLERAELLGHVLTREPILHLVANGQEIMAKVDGRRSRFALPDPVETVRLVSRYARPAHVRDDSDDHRQLGVAVSRIVLDGRVVALDDARLAGGWHALEAGADGSEWRWTDGDATLTNLRGGTLDIDVIMTERYWLDQNATRDASHIAAA